MQKTLIYKIEIRNAIPTRGIPKKTGITYCKGWDDHTNMGISVICATTLPDHHAYVFCADNFEGFQSLVESAEVIVGFNSLSFDDKVCAANGIHITTHYDILRRVYAALGLVPYPSRDTAEYSGYGLDAMARANKIGSKIGNGALTPELWQNGEVGTAINDCMHDVNLTTHLYQKIYRDSELVSPHGGTFAIFVE